MISDATYAMAVDTLGVEQLIELLTTIGFYTTASIIINAFQIPAPDAHVTVKKTENSSPGVVG